MNPTKNKRERLTTIALALACGVGLIAGSAQAQNIIEVGGAGVIADEALTGATLPREVNWTAAGGVGQVFSSLISPPVTVGVTGPVTLTFDHRYFIEDGWDGGAVFVSINGGTATYLPGTAFSANGYVGDTLANTGSAWPGGEEVFYNKSAGYDTPALIQSVADLGSLTAGDTVSVQFRGGWDGGYVEPTTNWEMGAVQISDTGGALLDVDFSTDGSSGFTVVSDPGLAGPWIYLEKVSRFEIDADLLTADRYQPNVVGSVIDLNGAHIQVVLLAGTLNAGDSFTLFDLSGGTTLTGSLGSLTLPSGTWDTSTLAVDGKITLIAPALPASQLGVLDLAANGGINPNTSAPWQVGDKYRLAFYTDGTTLSTSNDPQFYRDFVTTEAWTVPALQGSYWTPMITLNLDSNFPDASAPLLTAKEFSGTGDLTGGSGAGGAGEPVYVVDGSTCIARNNADIWNSWSNPFEASLGTPDASGNGNNTQRVSGVYYSPFLTQNGVQLFNPDAVHGATIATGCSNNGGTVRPLGTSADANPYDINTGSSNANNSGRVWNRFGSNATSALRLYAISYPLTIVDANETALPTLVSIEDGQGGADSVLGVAPIVYTVSFSEAIDIKTLSIADFGNSASGTATVTVDSVRPTFDPAVFTVSVTPTSTGTVQLQVNAAADVKDLAGNALDTTSAIIDDTTITVVLDTTAPTLTSIVDNVSGGPILAFTGLTYTVTFDEAIDAASIDIADFGNGGTAPITVDSVSPTGDPAIFEVAVSTTGPGSLTFEILTGASITDLVGNPLDTAAALPDDTTITVDPDPLPTLVSIVDNQGGGPVFETQSFAYMVTFDQVIDPASLDTGDFDNADALAITVNAVAATSDPSVFSVHVTPGGTGTITLQVDPAAVITNTNGTALDPGAAAPDDTTITVDAGSGPLRNTITVVNTAAFNNGGSPVQASFDATGADKLVVVVTGENGNPGSLVGDCTGVTFGTAAFTQAVDRSPIGGTPFDQTYNDIWYLDNPTPGTDVLSATVNSRGNVTVFALSGTAPGVGQTAVSAQASKSVVLSTTFAESIVIASHGMGGDGNSANVTSVDADLPLIEVSAQENGSNWDGHVTAYAILSSPGTASYSFTGGSVVGSHTIAAEFLAAVNTSDYLVWSGGYPGADLSDPDADYDGDGLTNDFERLFGLDPTSASSINPYSAPLNAGGGTFSFTRRDNALTGKFTDIETSTDLQMWTVDNGAVLVDNGPGGNGVEIVDVTLSAGLLSAPKLFVRVRQRDALIPLSANFEADNGGFTVATTAGSDWVWGDPDSDGFGGTVSQGNGGSTNCWGTNIGNPGYYINPTTTCLRSSVIDLTGIGAAELTFAEALDLQAGDTAVVNIIEELTDTVISSAIYTATDAITSSSNWELANGGTPIPIPPAAIGQKVRLEWCLTGQADDYFGWYIDDVTVQELAP